MDSQLCQTQTRHTLERGEQGPLIHVGVFGPPRPTGRLVFVAHGRNGKADAPHMTPVIRAYLGAGYTVVAPDCAHSCWNDSEGEAADFTMARHVADLRRSIEWATVHARTPGGAEELVWDGGRFALAGHSMGAYAACRLAATDYRDRTEHVLAVSPVVSGRRQIESRALQPGGLEDLRREVPGALEEWPRHDLFEIIHALEMPVGVIVGADDTVTRVSDVQDFCRHLPNPTGLNVVDHEHHCLLGPGFDRALAERLGRLRAVAA